MFTHNLIKRSVVAGLVIGAASLPAAAQARFIEDPPAPVTRSAVNAPSAKQQLARLHADLQQRSAAQVARPSAASPVRSPATSQGGFQWGDAGIGAAGAVLLLGTGAGAASVMRRRRVHRPVIG